MRFTSRASLAVATALVAGVTIAGGGYAAQATAPTPTVREDLRGGLDLDAITPVRSEVEIHGAPRAPRSADSRMFRALPAAYSNEKLAPVPGSQGKVASCVSWAVGYSGYGTLMNKQNIPGFPTAPMFLHSQLSGEKDQGTTVPAALDMVMEQGIPMAANYWQGPFDYSTLPTREQRKEATQYKLSGYYRISPWNRNAKQRIMDAVSQQMPVIASFRLLENFRGMDKTTAANYSYWPEGEDKDGHAMEIIAYTKKGVVIQNTWGEKWGNGGRFTMSWDALLNSDTLVDLEVMGDIDYRPFGPRPTTPSNTGTSTATSSTTATSTATPTSTAPETSTMTTITFFPRAGTATSTTTAPVPTFRSLPAGSAFPTPAAGTPAYYFTWNGHKYFWDSRRSWLVG